MVKDSSSEPWAYQICGTSSGGRTIGSPGLQLKAFAKAGVFERGPMARHLSGACGSTVT